MTADALIRTLEQAMARSPKRVGLIRVTPAEHRALYDLQDGVVLPYASVDWTTEMLRYRGIPVVAAGGTWVRHQSARERQRRLRQAVLAS